MKRDLIALREELAAWRDDGLVLPLWWRDDDATQPSPALDRLLRLAADFGAPLHLAVIPEPAGPDLAGRLADSSRVLVLPHGWRHRNHSPASEKKAEFGAHRPLEVMLGEVAQGWQRLQLVFGALAVPVFTPPWNRIAPSIAAALPSAGMAALSTYRPRRGKHAAPGLLEVNTHVDPIDWKGRRLLDPALTAAGAAARLSARRRSGAHNDEPFGVLTHHLVHDEEIWSFTASLFETLLESGVVEWTSPLAELGAKSRS